METNFDKIKLPKRAPIPFVNDYQPELDTAPVLNAAQVNHFQSQIGVLICKVELRRIDIMTKASLLSSHLAMPREGNIDAVYRIFGCLKHKHNSCVIFDPTYPLIEQAGFNFLIWGFLWWCYGGYSPKCSQATGQRSWLAPVLWFWPCRWRKNTAIP